VRLALKRLSALRRYMRSERVDRQGDAAALQEAGLTESDGEAMYRLLALARIEDRYVVPTVGRSEDKGLFQTQGRCGFSGVD
jgi:nitrate reductase beta subunit